MFDYGMLEIDAEIYDYNREIEGHFLYEEGYAYDYQDNSDCIEPIKGVKL